MKVQLPIGGYAILPGGTPEEAARREKFMEARYRFVLSYAESKGWPANPDHLSMDQIMEIRSQPGWKAPADGGEPMHLTGTLIHTGKPE